MRVQYGLLALALTAALPGAMPADDTMWDRRDPNSAHLFYDLRARQVGDLLTIVIDETTGSDAEELRSLAKQTSASSTGSVTGSSSTLGQILRSFAGAFDLESTSARTFDAKANTIFTRNFTDRMTVVVVAVLPNGNLVVEGCRQRMIAREMRTLRVVGLVRAADIGAYNTVQSQFIGNLHISYSGRGPESSYMNNGWGGRIFNKLWPY